MADTRDKLVLTVSQIQMENVHKTNLPKFIYRLTLDQGTVPVRQLVFLSSSVPHSSAEMLSPGPLTI